MKFLHTSDLHIGKIVNGFSMLEDQKYILEQIRVIALSEQVDAVVIAGDIYDRSIPSVEAVELLDGFLTSLLEKNIPVIMISGNHDSGERVAFADKILEKQGLYIAGGSEGEVKQVVMKDEYGKVIFTCLPFVKPAVAGAKSSVQAVENILSGIPMVLDMQTRQVLVTHFFVTGEGGETPELSDSETGINVGGLDNVPASLFGMFDYVALGHIHKPQRIGNGPVYYSGSPLKYSFSEAKGKKYVNVVTLQEKGKITVEKKELAPLHEMRILKGKLGEVLLQGLEEGTNAGAAEDGREDYIQAILTDKVELLDPIGSLRSVYPNIMQIVLEKNLKGESAGIAGKAEVGKKTTAELFSDFYEMLTGERPDAVRMEIINQAAEKAEEENAGRTESRK